MEKEKNIEKLVEQYSKSALRARRIFLISNITAILLFTGFFNLKWTWLRHFAESVRPQHYLDLELEHSGYKCTIPAHANCAESPDVVKMREEFARVWATDFQFVDFRLVGAKIFVDDLPLLGGAALAVIMTWYYFARRRERGVVKELAAIAARETDYELIRFIYYGVSYSLIFNTIAEIDESDRGVNRGFARAVIGILFYAPCIVVVTIILNDVWQTANAPVGMGNLLDYLAYEEQYWQIGEIFIRTTFACGFLVYSAQQVSNVRRLSAEDLRFRRQIEERYLNPTSRSVSELASTTRVRQDEQDTDQAEH